MRLINVTTLGLEEFSESNTPRYACLSHRWSSQEVNMQEWQVRDNLLIDRLGYSKIIGACHVAQTLQIQYLWADTCCIDKTNSTELSEAINSMWKWYKECALCVVYLSDVDDAVCKHQQGESVTLPDGANQFAKSQWFTRSWTLQELIAPTNLTFYNSSWERLGSKIELLAEVETVTNIAQAALKNFDTEDWSVAQRMSWAASRKSTRSEDIAYSLLGIFDVNMPLLYGEGSKAFLRLQQEILASATDTSILAWEVKSGEDFTGELLAPSPASFALCNNTVVFDLVFKGQAMEEEVSLLSPIGVSNLGIDIEVMLSPWRMNIFLAYIARHNDIPNAKSEPCFMVLKRVGNDNLMKRCSVKSNITLRPTKPERKDIQGFEKRRVLIAFKNYEQTTITFNGIRITSSDKLLGQGTPDMPFEHIWTPGIWQDDKIVLGEASRSCGTVAVSVIPPDLHYAKVTVVLLGFDRDYNPMCLIFEEDAMNLKCQTILRQDAKALDPKLTNSRWTWKRWDDNDRVHLRTTYKWLDLDGGAVVYKSIDRQSFVADRHRYVNVRFHKKNGSWIADIYRGSGVSQPPDDTNDVAHVLNSYRTSLQQRWRATSKVSRRPQYVVPAENFANMRPHIVDYSPQLTETKTSSSMHKNLSFENNASSFIDTQSLEYRRQAVSSGIYPMQQMAASQIVAAPMSMRSESVARQEQKNLQSRSPRHSSAELEARQVDRNEALRAVFAERK